MVLNRVVEPPNLLVATVCGVLTLYDQADLVAWVREEIRESGPVRILVLLDRFAGWGVIAGTDDDALWLRDDELVLGMAIVGEPQWKFPVLTVTAQPIRGFPIAFFDTEAAARSWLDARERALASTH